MAGKFYAVRKGKVPGIYNSWDACKRMVDGYPGAIYKSFKSKKEAEDFVAGGASVAQNTMETESVTETATDYAFVDGSFNIATGVYGFGGFLVAGEEHICFMPRALKQICHRCAMLRERSWAVWQRCRRHWNWA